MTRKYFLTRFRKGRKGECKSIAGSGREENRNNVYPHAAAFAQPSGLAYCPDRDSIFIADSESSSIRELRLEDGKVNAVVGGDRNPSVIISNQVDVFSGIDCIGLTFFFFFRRIYSLSGIAMVSPMM